MKGNKMYSEQELAAMLSGKNVWGTTRSRLARVSAAIVSASSPITTTTAPSTPTTRVTSPLLVVQRNKPCRFFVTVNLMPHRCERVETHVIHKTHLDFVGCVPVEITWRVDPPYIVE